MSVIDSQDEMGSSGSKHKGMSTPSGLAGPSGAGSKKGGDRKSARARTVLSEKQLHILKTCYANNARPDALMKEQLVEMTGLSPRVIRVWFQNKRCKDKKIQNRMIEKQMQRETVGAHKSHGSLRTYLGLGRAGGRRITRVRNFVTSFKQGAAWLCGFRCR
jgi:hypothetical protein